MSGFDASINMADYYFPMLDKLSSKAKLYLVRKLTDSLLKNETAKAETFETKSRDVVFRELCGAWKNDSEADMMEREILGNRMSNKTRNIASFDE